MNNTDREREAKRGKRRIAEIRIRNRSSSVEEIRELISKKRGRNSPEEKGRIEKTGIGDEKGEIMNKEKEIKYSELMDKQLLLYLVEAKK